MSRWRMRAKVDTVQPAIVKGLEAYGIEVYPIRHPVDLLLRFWCARHKDHCWMPLEIKTPQGKRKPVARQRTEQRQQLDFLTTTNTPAVISLEAALYAINARHTLESVTLQTHVRPLEITA